MVTLKLSIGIIARISVQDGAHLQAPTSRVSESGIKRMC